MLVGFLLFSVAAASARLEIPFGKGWRWHRGDAPNGPEYGSGRVEHFKLVKHCINMRHHLEWIPGGDKSAGQPYIVCGRLRITCFASTPTGIRLFFCFLAAPARPDSRNFNFRS